MAVRPSDIVVIGAGIVGCAVAYELARRGASVEVVEMRVAGMGATQAAAGMLAPYIEAREDSPLLDLTVRSLDLYDQLIADVSRDSAQAVPHKRTGTHADRGCHARQSRRSASRVGESLTLW